MGFIDCQVQESRHEPTWCISKSWYVDHLVDRIHVETTRHSDFKITRNTFPLQKERDADLLGERSYGTHHFNGPK